MDGGAAGASREHGSGDGPLARLILDTTVLVDAERGGDSLDVAIDDGDDVAVAAVTVAELKVGVQLAKGRRREKRERFVAAVLGAVSVEAYDLDVADAHAGLLAHVRRTGTPRGAHDLIIAATARAQDRHVVSSDQKAFADLPGVSVAGDSD
ncbi:MAG TPA: PIN domain-containing protein [Solirubrobacterales bacterium]|nr:PIN domain-containing protein [Solirubrobacterales bacterium]